MTDRYSIPPPDVGADRQDRARSAKRLLERRRRRIWTIRKRVIAGSVAAFGVAWVAIGFQLVSGNDPALSKTGKTGVVRTTPETKSKKSSSTGSSSGSSTKSSRSGSTSSGSTSTGSTSAGPSQSSSANDSSQPLAPVTTQQS